MLVSCLVLLESGLLVICPLIIVIHFVIDSIDLGVLDLDGVTAVECLDAITEDFRLSALIALSFTLLGRILDDVGNFGALAVVHLEEHLLRLARLDLVVVDQKIAQDPLVELDPGLEAAAELAAALVATFVSLLGFLVGVKSEIVLALHAVIELLSTLLLGEEAGLNASDSGTEENGGECD